MLKNSVQLTENWSIEDEKSKKYKTEHQTGLDWLSENNAYDILDKNDTMAFLCGEYFHYKVENNTKITECWCEKGQHLEHHHWIKECTLFTQTRKDHFNEDIITKILENYSKAT